MGYSCSARARITLDQVDCLDEFDIDSPNYKYFIEIGKENKDGAITGTVYRIQEAVFDGANRTCKKAGSFKIDANGSIVRFPGISRRVFGVLEIASMEAYDREFSRYNYVHS